MIYQLPKTNEPIDQGDLIDNVAVTSVTSFDVNQLDAAQVQLDQNTVIVLTQTCDIANKKTESAIVASVFDAQQLVDQKVLKASDFKGPIRAGRAWGVYFLPANDNLGLNEMIVDLRRLHTVRLDLLSALCREGKRRARLQVPYREHLAKHFGDTFCRIGLPQPYETI